MAKEYLHYRLGKENLLGLSLIGWVLILVSVGACLNVGMEGIVIAIPGVFIVVSYTGILLDPQKNRIKEYTWVAFLKVGRWHSLVEYEDIVILKKNRRFGYNLRGNGPFQTFNEGIYEICFVNRNHFEKVLICRIRDKEQAYQEGRKIADQMKRDIVQYNPGMRNRRKVL